MVARVNPSKRCMARGEVDGGSTILSGPPRFLPSRKGPPATQSPNTARRGRWPDAPAESPHYSTKNNGRRQGIDDRHVWAHGARGSCYAGMLH